MSLEKVPSFLVNLFEAEMNGNDTHSYRFNSFLLDVAERQLFHDHKAVQLTPKAFDVLVYLVEHSGHLVEKDKLMNACWPDSFVEEVNLPRTIHTLRRALHEDENGNKFIETVPTKGYRFVAKVNVAREQPAQKSTNGKQEISAVVENFAETVFHIPPSVTDEPVSKQRHPTRIILFTVGFLSALFLIFLLSFNFQSASSVNPNDIKSIAVLPLKPLTAENRDSIYELGIADSLILKLSSAKNLIVRELSATRQYADIEQDAIAAGREQKVDYVLASNYQIAAGKIRITSQLINVESGLVEDVFKVEQENSSIFSIQDAVAANIGGSLLKRLNREPNNHLAKRYTSNEEAYRLYLLGTTMADKRGRKNAEKAIEYFEQAVKLDPNYAPAYAGMANARTGMAFTGRDDAREQYLKAKSAIETALALDDNLAESHTYSGEIKWVCEWDFAGAEREHKRAIELNPNSSAAHRMYALYLSSMGRFDDAIAEIKIAVDLEPALALNHRIYGGTLVYARRYDEAIARLKQTLEMDPDFIEAYRWLIAAYAGKGDDDQAFEWFVKLQTKQGEEPHEIQVWKTIYAKSGWRGIYERQFEAAKEAEKKGEPNYTQLANLSVDLVQPEQAIAYLEKAMGKRQWGTVFLNVTPHYDSLRSDPRFDDLVRRVGLK